MAILPKISRIASFNLGVGFDKVQKENFRIFVTAMAGLGSSEAVVRKGGSDSLDFPYSGKYQQFSLNPGFKYNFKNGNAFMMIMQQSLVNFSTYKLPLTTYKGKMQYLFIPQVQFDFGIGRQTKFGFFVAVAANGKQPGERSSASNTYNLQEDEWCRLPATLGFKFTHRFDRFNSNKR